MLEFRTSLRKPDYVSMFVLRTRILNVKFPTHVVEKVDERHGPDTEIPEAHQDERQIRLDTDRSFVLYPVSSS